MKAKAKPRGGIIVGFAVLIAVVGLSACTPEEVSAFNTMFSSSISVEQADAACVQVESVTGPDTCANVVVMVFLAAQRSQLSPRDLGQQMAAERGWTGHNWQALDALWQRESGWNPNARNRSSGACGIPQALPCSRIPDHSVAGQIRWGLDYIQGRYGTPDSAWSHSQRGGWY